MSFQTTEPPFRFRQGTRPLLISMPHVGTHVPPALATRQRNVAADAGQPQVATAMTLQALQGGAQASGRAVGGLAVGQQADFSVLDAAHPALAGLDAAGMLSSHVFASHRTSAIDAVWVAGEPRVQAGRHRLHEGASAGFVAARRQLLQDSR